MSLIILRQKGRSITQGCKSIARATSGQSLDLPKGEMAAAGNSSKKSKILLLKKSNCLKGN